jgi:hypothetical protein
LVALIRAAHAKDVNVLTLLAAAAWAKAVHHLLTVSRSVVSRDLCGISLVRATSLPMLNLVLALRLDVADSCRTTLAVVVALPASDRQSWDP